MPHLEVCFKCRDEYFVKNKRYPKSLDRFKAIYRKEIRHSDEGAAELSKRLARYWYRSSGGVSKFKACERCYRHDPSIAECMEHVPDGWMVLSKGEMIDMHLSRRCIIL